MLAARYLLPAPAALKLALFVLVHDLAHLLLCFFAVLARHIDVDGQTSPDQLLPMRAARPAARPAHAASHLRYRLGYPYAPRLGLLTGGYPAYPLVASERSDVFPEFRYFRIRHKSLL